MLTNEDFHSWCLRNSIPPEIEMYIQRIRSSQPVRKVRSGISNICGRYPSVKMGRTIQFESQHVELWGIYEMERDQREMNMTRDQLLHDLSATLCSLSSKHTLRVALDGIDAAGKTTLADELAPLIEAQGRPVIRASIDGFHQPRSVRLKLGSLSPEGYYEDSFDYASLRTVLLDPLGPQGNGCYQRAVFDFRTDTPLVTPLQEAPPNAVLLFDGVFLLRPELVHQWDYRIFVYVKMERALQRALRRDLSLFGSEEVIRTRYLQRYQPGQRLYYQIARPHEQANVLVDNNDPSSPQLLFPSQTVSLSSLEL